MSKKADGLGKHRSQENLQELRERIDHALPQDGGREQMPGFFFARASQPIEAVRNIYEPALCFVAQGRKRAMLADEIFVYDPGNYLIFTVDLPILFKIEEASVARPYLGGRLLLDPAAVASVIMESGIEFKKGETSVKAMDVSSMSADLLDAVVRMARLIDSPEEAKILAPLIKKEILYRLLRGGQGARLAHLFSSTGDTRRISKAIGHLRAHYDQPLKMENIAQELGMSVSGFHHHFKSVTAMSPLQFQKNLRLQEARRLMLSDDLDAASAGFRVGYEDPSYFSRDYKKQFGQPPQRDISRLRATLET